jgi:cytochrome c553
MREHFTSVMAVHEALVRGDTDSARAHSRTIAELPNPDQLPKAALSYLDVMRNSAARAASADELEDVAAMTGAMLALCGDCHRGLGVTPSRDPRTNGTNAGGTVGHMMAHKRAVDLMIEGLTVPSASAWTQGAKLLSGAPLYRSDLKLDANVQQKVLDLERDVHGLATRAASADDDRSRVFFYSEIMQRCAACHSLSSKASGTRNPR